jgi:hypothetical protein
LVFASSYSGITPGGSVNSRTGLNNAIQATATNGQILVIDCAILCNIGTTTTNPIFLPSNLNMRWEPGGVIITDGILLPLFVILNSTNITFENYTTSYIGTFGVTAIDALNPASSLFGLYNTFNTGPVQSYMVANWGNTFTGVGVPFLQAPTNACAQILMSGQATNIIFRGKTSVTVPSTAPACNFLPMFLSTEPNWLPSTVVTSNGAPTPSTGALPNYVLIEDLDVDGILMGIQGSASNLVIKNATFRRYTDLQDANGNNVGGQQYTAYTIASPTSPFTSTTLTAGNWAYATGSTTVTFSDGSTRTATFTNGSNVVTWTTAVASGLGTTMLAGWSAYWFAPPHAIYLDSFFTGFPCTFNINGTDVGQYVGAISRRSTGSGYLNSYKGEVANNSVINWATARPDGGLDCMTYGNANGNMTLDCNFNSATAQTGQLLFAGSVSGQTSATLTAPWPYGTGTQTYPITFSDGSVQTGTFLNGSTVVSWGSASTGSGTTAMVKNTSQSANFFYRFPSSYPTLGFNLNVTAIDEATAPVAFGGIGSTIATNSGVHINSVVTMNDVPLGSTFNPGSYWGGTDVIYNLKLTLNSMSTTQSFISVFPNTGSTTLMESSVDITVTGWRSASLTWTAAPASAATSGTLTAFPYGNGVYLFAFSTGEQRLVTISGTGATWSVGLVAAATTAVKCLLLLSNNSAYPVDSMKNRALVMQGGKGYGLNYIVRDTTNGIVQTIQNGVYNETWTQLFMGPVTGTPITTSIVFPTTFAVTSWGYDVVSALTGASSLSMGWSGSTTALINAGATATGSNPWSNPAAGAIQVPAATAILLTPNATITGGSLYCAVTGQRFQMSG